MSVDPVFFEKLVWQPDRMLLNELIFRLEHYRNEQWELGDRCFVFYKIRHLVEQYARFLSQRPDFDADAIFEIGMWDGGSVAFWNECFHPAKHVAIDLTDREDSAYFLEYLASHGLEEKVKTFWATDQGDAARLREIVASEFSGPLDLVIDDASHLYGPTKASFETLFPLLRPKGLYIIEDWAWGHWAEFQAPDHPWSRETPLTRLVVDLVEATGSSRGNADSPPIIDSVSVHQGFAVVERGAGPLEEDFELDREINFALHQRQPALDEELREMQSLLKGHLDLQSHARVVEQKLAAIEGSRVWRGAQHWYRVKRKLSDASDRHRARKIFSETDATVAGTKTPTIDVGTSALNKTVLFVTHDARYHEAQFVLLHLLRWLAENTSIRFEVLLQEGGPLKAQFETLAPVTVWHEVPEGDITTPMESDRVARAMEILRRSQVGLIYSNTLANGDILYLLSKAGLPAVCHVHELSHFMTYGVDPFFRRQMRRHVDRFIAASHAVKESLERTMRIQAERVSVVHEFIPTRVQPDTPPEAIKQRLAIPDSARIVGGAGTTEWKTGPDLFVQLALAVQKRRLPEPVHFVWIGGAKEGAEFAALWHDAVHAGIGDHVHFLGHRKDAASYVAASDVFALTSREDPYPLACLEAAACSKPIVCFDGSGGARELVEDDSGFVVPYLDVDAMADRVVELLGSDELRSRLGNRAREKVRSRHDVSVAAPKIAEIIEDFLGRDRGSVRREQHESAR